MPDEQREPTQARVEWEPLSVREARRKIAEWEARNGHDSYVDCLNGGFKGYQAACWDCDWRGPEHLRGDEEMDTPESRAHKRNARADAADHQLATRPAASPSEQREGEATARVDLAERLRARADYKPSAFDMQPMPRLGGGDANLLREAASTLDHQTKALEAADRLLEALEEQAESDTDIDWVYLSDYRNEYRAARTTKGGHDDV